MTRTKAEISRAPHRPRRARTVAAVVLAVVAVFGSSALSAGAQSDSERELDGIRDRQELLADELDALRATDAEVDAALDELEARIAEQERRVVEARSAATEAEADLVDAQAQLRAARDDVDEVERQIVEMAVSAYIHPPAADLARGLEATDLNEAVVQQTYLDVRANRDLDLLADRRRAQEAAARAEKLEAAASGAADRAARAAEAELVALEDDRAVQASFAGEVHRRIDAALAEAAVLEDLDAAVSARIAREQAALIARLPPATVPPTTTPPAPPTTVPATTVPVTTTSASTTTVPDDGELVVDGDDEPSDPEVDPDADPDAGAGPDDAGASVDEGASDEPEEADEPPRPSTPTPPLVTVRGFQVHADIADDVAALLDAAEAAGLSLGGSAYRSTERQIELREAHCGPTSYDIWEKPASQCRPPTAVPGRSLHEQGRALDFTNAGRLITSRSNEAFQWLADNAATYGLFNLPSEPWHWSTTGG